MRFVKEWEEVSPGLIWVRTTLGCERWVFVSAYGLGSEEERNDFWEELSVCLSGFGADESVVLL